MANQKNGNSSALDRRQFVKGAVASTAATAAVGMLPVGAACAITRDQNGRAKEWVCIVDVVHKSINYWIYKMRNCRTGEEWTYQDDPGLPTGDCGAPQTPACVEREIWDRYERIMVDGKEVVLSPKMSQRRRLGR